MAVKEKNDLLELFLEFESIFVEINDEWIISCQENIYTEYEQFASQVQLSVLNVPGFSHHLSEICAALLRYEQKAKDGEEIWEDLTTKNMRAEKFVLFLWSLIERALSGKVDIEERITGLLAASTYMAICSLNGSQAYCIFNQFLFQRSVEVLRMAYRLLTLNGFCGMRSQVGKSKKQNAGRKRKQAKYSCHEETAESTIVDTLTPNDEAEFKELLFSGLDSLFVFLNKVSLSACHETAICTANLIKDVMQIDLGENTEIAECRCYSDFQQKRLFSDRSFALMHRLIARRHSGAELVLSRIIMPRLLFWTFENTVLPAQTHPTKLMELTKNLMLNFLKSRYKKQDQEELDSTLHLLGNMCYRCPDRSDYRPKVADCVCKVVEMLPDSYRYKFTRFLVVFASNSRTSCRNFAVELIPLVIRLFGLPNLNLVVKVEAEKLDKREKSDELQTSSKSIQNNKESVTVKPQSANVMGNESFKPVEALLSILVQACDDKAPTVRARAIFQLAEFMGDSVLRDALPHYFRKLEEKVERIAAEPDCNSRFLDEETNLANLMLKSLLNRAQDPKASARKSAIHALEVLFPHLESSYDIRAALDCLQKRCRDESLSIRKQAAESISKIVLIPFVNQQNEVDRSWLLAVLPLITDREQSVVKLAAELIAETLITPLLTEKSESAWRLLSAVEQEVNHRRLLFRAIVHQVKEDMLSDKIVSTLLKKISKQPERANITWMLLKDLSVVFKVDPVPAYQFWFSLHEHDSSNITFYIAHVLAHSSDRLNESARQRLLEDMEEKLLNFRLPENHIPSVYYAFAKLHNGVGEKASGSKIFSEISETLGARCYQTMVDILYLPQSTSQPSQVVSTQTQEEGARQLLRVICTMGEIVQYVPSLKIDKWFSELQLIMASDVIQHQLTRDGFHLPTPVPSRPPTQATDTQRHSNFVGNLQPTSSAGMHTVLTPTFLHKTIANICVVTSEVRAQAVIAIGKMCMLNVKLAKMCIPIFAKQVHTNSDHLVRNNIVIVVCDLCIRYTFLVDRYSEILASCLSDESTLVRKQTLILLTNLIKEAFIRWEGQIMYRFVSTLLDEVTEIREYAEMCLVDVLLVQFPNIISNHFIECLFYFNAVAHRSWTVLGQDNEEKKQEVEVNKSCLRGSAHKEKRMKLYVFMVKTFDDQAKLEIMKRISNEVFFATAEGVLNIAERNVCALLEDCYDIMCLKELKLSMAVGARGDGDDDENDYPVEVVAEVKKVFAKVFRSTIIDNVLPGIINLKYFLQDKMLGNLARGVWRVLRELSRDHREQLEEFLASDQRLKSEIEYDLRKLEELEEREKQRALADEQERAVKRKSLRQSLLSRKKTELMRSSAVLLERTNLTSQRRNSLQKQSIDVEKSVKNTEEENIPLTAEKTLVQEVSVNNDKTLTKGAVADGTGMIVEDRIQAVNCVSSSQELFETDERPAESASLFGDCSSINVSNRKRRSKKITTAKRATSPFIVSPTQRKHLKTTILDGSHGIEGRAISTPLHPISEVTFSFGELSAIAPPTRRTSRRRRDQRLS